MPEQRRSRRLTGPADPRANTIVKFVLRIGLSISLVLLVIGLVIQLAGGHDEAVQVKMFDLFGAHAIGEEIMGLGVLVLALTPACGVLSLVASWIRERDTVFIAVGVIVVAVLTAAVVVGFG